MKVYDLESDSSALQIACEVVQSGGIIAFPTDTIYGLCASPTKIGITKLHKIRERPLHKPFLFTLPENYHLESLIKKPCSKQKEFINRHWPGKISLLFPKKEGTPYPSTENIVLRKPNKKDCIYFHQFLAKLKYPILSTSINPPDEEPMDKPSDIMKIFSESVDAYFKLSNYIKTTPSQIWDLTIEPYRRIR